MVVLENSVGILCPFKLFLFFRMMGINHPAGL